MFCRKNRITLETEKNNNPLASTITLNEENEEIDMQGLQIKI